MPPELIYHVAGRCFVYPLSKDEITIGRSPSNDVVVEDPTVSRKHAKLCREGNSWRVVDLGSSYGTKVNGERQASVLLRDGDRISLQRFQLTFVEKKRRGLGAFLTPRGDRTTVIGGDTVFLDAVDFSALAASPTTTVHLQKLLALVTESSRVILTAASLDDAFRKVLDLVFEQLPAQRGFVMLWDEERQDLVTRCVKNLTESGRPDEIQFSRTIAEKVYREKVAVLTLDAQTDQRFAEGESVIGLGIRSAMAAPLWHGDDVDGLIYVDTPVKRKAFDQSDLDLLSALGNHLAIAIEQSRLQNSVMEQKLKRRRLERYHAPAVVEQITRDRDYSGERLVADEREVTVLFADVVGFSDRCESMEPREVAELLNRYFSEMGEVIFHHEGTLDKFIGDCLMAVFGAPLVAEDHPRRAVEAALDMREALESLNEPLPEESRLEFRVGMHSGRVVAGDIGSLRRCDYTVLGATVNLAARLEAVVAQPGQIVMSEVTREVVKDLYETSFIGEHQPKGIARPVRCYELLGRKT